MSRLTSPLSRREREIMDIVYARGQATAAEIRAAMADPPTDAAVRATLRILVNKRHLRIESDGPRFRYWPAVSREVARRSALQHVVSTFFGGSVEHALATLLDVRPAELDASARRRLKRLIDRAVREGR